jgi:SAM-dependent methyltransferase
MSASKDADSTNRFTGLADIYAKARPSYPEPAIQFIIDTALSADGDQTKKVIADIGCGTGISSRLFAERGFRVVGLEPNDDMRRKAESDATYGGNLTYVGGTAEKTGFDSGSIDLVLCAQAFHWFRPPEALQEFARILKPGGWVALVWNERDESEPFTRAYGDALRQAPETAKVEMHRGKAGEVLLISQYFRNAAKHVFPNCQLLDENGALQRAFSASYAPKDAAGADRLRQALQQAFKHFSKDGLVEMRYETSVYLARKA